MPLPLSLDRLASRAHFLTFTADDGASHATPTAISAMPEYCTQAAGTEFSFAIVLFKYNKIAANPPKSIPCHTTDTHSCAILLTQKTVKRMPRNFPALP
jgi:hypothetical protein